MEPFVYLDEYSLLVCTGCQFATLGDEVPTHLRTRHPDIGLPRRAQIIEAVQQIPRPRLLCRQADLANLRRPGPEGPAIIQLAAPQTDGLGCRQCPYVVRQVQKMRDHCRTEHSWQNDWVKGGNVRQKAAAERALPWREGVRCQRWFPSRAGSHWFEVERGLQHAAGAGAEPGPVPFPGPDPDTRRPRTTNPGGIGPGTAAGRPGATDPTADPVGRRFLASIREKNEQFERYTPQQIGHTEVKGEPNLWLQRVGWVEHLYGADRTMLLAAAGLDAGVGWGQEEEGEEEKKYALVLEVVWESFDRLFRAAQETATLTVAGLNPLYEINRRKGDVKPANPFNSRMEPNTVAKYSRVWRRMLGYLWKTQIWPETVHRPPYELTDAQGDRFDELDDFILGIVRAGPSVSEEEQQQVDRQLLDLIVQLLDHAIPDTAYDSVLISALAAIGWEEDGQWASPLGYTPIYSAVIKVARMLVLQQSWVECIEGGGGGGSSRSNRGGGEGRPGGPSPGPGQGRGLFHIVRDKVQRFMTVTSATTDPGPMDWIFEARSYGMKIQFTTAVAGQIHWEGSERVIYQKTSFSMDQLRDMVYSLTQELHRTMRQLLFIEDNNDDDTKEEEVPAIDWAGTEDDTTDQTRGYSFLTDSRNEWAAGGPLWLARKVAKQPALRQRWLSRDTDDAMLYRADEMARYGRLVDQFRERLLILMHLTGGQPARAPEILSIRHQNTPYGGIRNVFIREGMVCFVIWYHKNMRSKEQSKTIHRFLPRSVGTELVRYLWLVLPFWQQMQGLAQKTDERSAFLFAHNIVRPQQPDRLPDDGGDSDGDGAGAGNAANGRHAAGGSGGGHARGPGRADGGDDPRNNQNDNNGANGGRVVVEEVWNSERMRRVLIKFSTRLLGSKINISNWRHFATAISRKHLNHAFKGSNIDEDSYEDDDDDDENEEDWGGLAIYPLCPDEL